MAMVMGITMAAMGITMATDSTVMSTRKTSVRLPVSPARKQVTTPLNAQKGRRMMPPSPIHSRRVM